MSDVGGTVAGAVRILEEAAALARSQGRTAILETEGLHALQALGWRVPRWRILEAPDDGPGRAAAPAGEVVVKLLSPALPHRSDIGAVRMVHSDSPDFDSVLAEVWAVRPDDESRLLIQEFIPHSHTPGAEILLGAHWTPDFGPVVTLGLGGVVAEDLQALAGEGVLATRFSPRLGAVDLGGALERILTGAVRGHAGWITQQGLVEAVAGFSAVADALLPHVLSELEVNPLVFCDGRPVPLDALGSIAESSPPPRHLPNRVPARDQGIQSILQPESVAVVGVSTRMNPGRVILRNLLAAGFPPEAVRVVKDGSDEMDGCRCVASVEQLHPPVDLLVVSVAAGDVPALMEKVVQGERARSVVLIPGGLGEGSENSRRGQAVKALLADAGDSAPVVNGGNCLGVRSLPGRLDTLFIPPEKLGFPDVPPHPVAVLSQSGAFAVARASALPWLNPRYVITVGNQLDVTLGEYLEHLADDPEVRVFACYVEGFQPLDGLRFMRAARRLAAEGRAVILYRAARTGAGATAAVSHTASLAGEYAVTRALAHASGVLLAESLDDFGALLTVSLGLDSRSVSGPAVGALSNAGFECVAMADSKGDLVVRDLEGPTRDILAGVLARHRLEGIVAPRNPLDVTPILGDAAFIAAAEALLDDAGVDVAVVGCVPLTPALQTLDGDGEDVNASDGVLAGLASLWSRTEKAWVAVVDGGPRYDTLASGLTGVGIPTFRRADTAASALDRYVRWRLRAAVTQGSSRG